MDCEDQGLVDAFRAGEESAFAALVIKYRESVYRVARRMLGSHEDAADVTQETFLRAYRALGGFAGRSRLRTWLYRIVVNLCLDHRGRLARMPLLAAEEDAALSAQAPRRDDPSDTIERAEVRWAVARAVASLPPRQRAMVVLRLYQDMPYAEIAAVLACSEGTVKATMFTAVRKLRRALAAYAETPDHDV